MSYGHMQWHIILHYILNDFLKRLTLKVKHEIIKTLVIYVCNAGNPALKWICIWISIGIALIRALKVSNPIRSYVKGKT